MSHDDHDAQHAFKKKALRNVRGLLDNLEKSEVTMTVRFDGLIEAVSVQSWSGHPAIEPTAKRIVMLAASCGAFPEEIRRDTDVLYVTRTLEFGEKLEVR